MNKEQCEAVAEIVKEKNNLHNDDAPSSYNIRGVLAEVACDLADLFEKDNPNFDRDKFLKACGLN